LFYYLEGSVAELEPNLVVLDCGGVGYALNTTANTLASLSRGERCRLYVSESIREDAFDLYGFYTREEKRSFEMLVGVSGVGPKVAQSILSSNTPEALSLAIVSGNEKALTAVPGIGKKIAQRILLELKDKLGAELESLDFSGGPAPAEAPAGGGKRADAAAALSVLGYSSSEIAAALKGLDIQALSVEDIIRRALRNMMQ
jgi:Holliday junction DNA helicase RuvA